MPKHDVTRIGFVGLGAMGGPMCAVIAGKNPSLKVFDINRELAASVASETGATVAPSLAELADQTDLVITMLPNAEIVHSVCAGNGGDCLVDGMTEGGLVIDMSSSYPIATRKLGSALDENGITLLDAPVSGGVRKATNGTLAIMLGGDNPDALDSAETVLTLMGTVFRTGSLGSGHALKALNNYVSAAGLAAASEAILVGEQFGLDPERMIDVINASTGRNNSTEVKFKPFILSGEYRKAAFALDLMAKDITAAAELAEALNLSMPGMEVARNLWAAASSDLGASADHTEIHRFISQVAGVNSTD
ncbi:NAD(P)-dependent oxidoreductase [Rhodobacteraceae bacterium NNCM2]|nr:NAD(P)-dependent oxidoreductase [Coraliihabitans acroporae]